MRAPRAVHAHRSYTYDGLDRLSGENDSLESQTGTFVAFDYDLAGNITSGGYNYENATATVPRPFQVTSIANSGVTFGYDLNGNQIDRFDSAVASNNQHRDFDRINMPWRIQTGAGSDGKTTELEYGGDGGRILKRKLAGMPDDFQTCNSGANPTACVSELTVDIGELYERVSSFGASSACDPDQAVAGTGTCAAVAVTHSYRVYAGGRQVAQVKREDGVDTTSYLHDDKLGSTTLITGDNKSVVERRSFDAFGRAEDGSGSFSSTSVLSGFTGHEHDEDLGLVNMRGRLYDPRLRRFISPDPFVMQPFDTQGLNRYAYVRNNPLRFTDPSGFEGDDDDSGIPEYDDAPNEKEDPKQGGPVANGSSQAKEEHSSKGEVTIAVTISAEDTRQSSASGTIAQPTQAPSAPEASSNTAGSNGSHAPAMDPGSSSDNGAPKSDAERVQNIINYALGESPCGASASCGPNPGQVAVANSSNELNRPLNEGEREGIRDEGEKTRALARAMSADALLPPDADPFDAVVLMLAPEVKVAGEGAEGTIELFRAVGPAEFEELAATGEFAAGPNSLGGKFFAETATDAAKWGEALHGAGNFRVVSVRLSKSAANQLMRWERLDGIGPARYGELEQLVGASIRAVQ